jgi:hypothetical protein
MRGKIEKIFVHLAGQCALNSSEICLFFQVQVDLRIKRILVGMIKRQISKQSHFYLKTASIIEKCHPSLMPIMVQLVSVSI